MSIINKTCGESNDRIYHIFIFTYIKIEFSTVIDLFKIDSIFDLCLSIPKIIFSTLPPYPVQSSDNFSLGR